MFLGMPEDLLAEVTSFPELRATSEAEQMYLITVARAAEAGAGAVLMPAAWTGGMAG